MPRSMPLSHTELMPKRYVMLLSTIMTNIESMV